MEEWRGAEIGHRMWASGALEASRCERRPGAEQSQSSPNLLSSLERLHGSAQGLPRQLAPAGIAWPLREARELFASMGYKPALAETDALLERTTAAAS